MTRPTVVATKTGLVDLLAPDPASISIDAMAHHLAQLNRYAGALELPFSVAQHSVLTCEIFRLKTPDLPAIYALLHDAPRYLWGDMTRPAQAALERELPDFGAVFQDLRQRTMGAIQDRFGLGRPTTEILAAVEIANDIALATEWRSFMPSANGLCPVVVGAWRGIAPKPLPWTDAADLFKATLYRELARCGAEVAA